MNKILKTLFTVMLCGSILLLDFEGRKFQMKQAEAASIKSSQLAATLTMVATGLVATRLWSYPKKSPDMLVAAAAGAAFIAGEIIAFAQFRDTLKDVELEIKRDKDGNIERKQIEVLEKLLESYEKAKNTGNTKKKFQTAAAAAFGVAAGMAAFFAAEDDVAIGACFAGLAAAAGPVFAASLAKCVGPQAPMAAGVKACHVAIVASNKLWLDIMLARETPQPSSLGATTKKALLAADEATMKACTVNPFAIEMALAKETPCRPAIAAIYANITFGPPPGNQSVKNELFKRNIPILVRFFQNLILESQAGSVSSPLSLLGLGGGVALSFVIASQTSIANYIDLHMLIPKRRAIVWAAMAATSMMASSATDEVLEKIEQNINKIRGILKKYDEMSSGVFADNPTLQNAIRNNTAYVKPSSAFSLRPADYNLKNVDDKKKYENSKLPCIAGEKNGVCNNLDSELKAVGGFDSLPTALLGSATAALDMGKALSGASGISESQMKGIESLGTQSKAINDRMRAERKKLEKVLNAKKKKDEEKVDFDKDENKFKTAMNKKLNENLAKSGLTLESAAKEFGAGLGTEVKEEKEAVATGSGAPANAIDMSAQGAPTVAAPDTLGDLDLYGDKALDGLDLNGAASTGASDKEVAKIEDYNLSSNIQSKGKNIFDIISRRYMSSGVKLLFEKKKIDDSNQKEDNNKSNEKKK